jgi:lantibiotic biosynthesis protein
MKLSDVFIVRTPLLAADSNLQDPIAIFSENKFVREAVLISSPTLFTKATNIVKGTEKDFETIERVSRSLKKYLKRFAYRSTPFGVSAGITCGAFTHTTDLSIGGYKEFTKHIRADMGVLGKIHRLILEDNALKSFLKFYPNNSIYKIGETGKCLKYSYTGKRNYLLSSFQFDETLEFVLGKCRDGKTLPELYASFADQGYDPDDITSFIDELVDEKILLSELEPGVNGEFLARKIVLFIKSIPFSSPLCYNILSLIEDLQGGPIEVVDSKYYSMKKSAAMHLGINDEDLFQVDTYKPAGSCSLDKEIVKSLDDAHRLIYGLNQGRTVLPYQNLQNFIAEFEKRYEGKEMPLLQVLDPDTGIGYPANGMSTHDPMIAGLRGSATDQVIETKHSTVFDVVLKKFYECIASNQNEITFSDADVVEFGKDVMTDSVISSLVSVLKCEDGHRLLHHATESSGINIAARFLHMPEVRKSLDGILQKEEKAWADGDAIIAEVSFLPDERVGNIIYKKQTWKHEIPILGPASADATNVIMPHDLLLSVRNGLLVIRDTKRDRFVIPKFSCLYDHHKAQVPLLSFLADYRHQLASRPLTWLWGNILNRMPYLPRVTYKNIILSRAQWTVSFKDFQSASPDTLIKHLKARGLPDKFCIALDDNLLPLDVTSIGDCELFIEELKRYSRLRIVEDLEHEYRIKDFVATDGDNKFRNEVILFWENEVSRPLIPRMSFNFKSQKDFLPGDNWLYWKIYCGANSVDQILINTILPLVRDLQKQKFISKWFFIRYADPDFHLRLRFELDPAACGNVRLLMNKKLEALFASSLVWNVKEDIYTRELIRYGDENIGNAETVFYSDSEFVAELLSIHAASFLDSERWKLGVLAIDRFLSDFNFDLSKKIEFITYARSQFFQNLQLSKPAIDILKANYRKHNDSLKTVLEGMDELTASAEDVLTLRSQRLSPVVKKITTLHENGALGVGFFELLLSFTHMSLNRLFATNHKQYETAVYDLLAQHYRSREARARKAMPNQSKTQLA